MAKLVKASSDSAGKVQAHGGILLAAIIQHLLKEVPDFDTIAASDFFKKTIESNPTGFTVALVFLQDYHNPNPELDELVLAQIMIFLAKSKQLDVVTEIVVNQTNSEFGSK